MSEIKTVAGRIARAIPSGKMDKPLPLASKHSTLDADPDCPSAAAPVTSGRTCP